jgi:GH24 family phage-related lysozyme (muramidase)
MVTSQKGIDLIKKWEGFHYVAYLDPVGVWTIGYGTTNADFNITNVRIKRGLYISQSLAEKWLKITLNQKYEPLVNKYIKIYNLTQNEYDALVSFCYNIGSIDQLTKNGTRTKEEIKAHWLAYSNAGGKQLQGLLNRRKDELNLFNSNSAPTPAPDIEKLAREVIAGKYGNGEARKKALGELYSVVQKRVNEILKGNNTSIYYTVVKGDNLTKIAKKYNVTIKYLKDLNNIPNANLIYVGQRIKIK